MVTNFRRSCTGMCIPVTRNLYHKRGNLKGQGTGGGVGGLGVQEKGFNQPLLRNSRCKQGRNRKIFLRGQIHFS